ncbi:MAG TPA: zinc-binding dehydrogenase [Alphaproteobacteria bacterium]|nr:zinc-binding dehydrogenase [Alphaproteobacteria bacterium]
MKAVYITEHGGIDKLTHGEVPDPVPDANEVLVRVRACGVNYIDLWVRRGLPFLRIPYPFVLGQEVAGEVVAVGPAVKGLAIGTRVLIHPGLSCGRCEACASGRDHHCEDYQLLGKNVPGGYADLIKIPDTNVLPLPASVAWEDAVGLPNSFCTAWNMVYETAKLQPGEWILIHAGGSGIGSAAIQLAKLVGANIITTASSDDKLARAQALGAQHLINYKEHDFLHRVRRITNRRGVDVVIEHIGEDVWERSLLCLARGGRLVTCGATSGYLPKLNLRYVFFRNLQILGVTSASKGVLCKVLTLLEQGQISPVVNRVLPLADARQAHQLLEERQVFGKLVLRPEGS